MTFCQSRCNISLTGRILDFSTNNIGGCDNVQYRPCQADIFPYTLSQRISRGKILLVLKFNIRPLRGVVYWISVLTLPHLSCKICRPPVTKQYRPAYIIMWRLVQIQFGSLRLPLSHTTSAQNLLSLSALATLAEDRVNCTRLLTSNIVAFSTCTVHFLMGQRHIMPLRLRTSCIWRH